MAAAAAAGEVVESKQWVLVAYASDGVPTTDHLKLRSVSFSLTADSVPDGHVAIELLSISIDPYIRTQMSGCYEGLYLPCFALGDVISAYGIGRVVFSKDSNFKEGDFVVNPFSPVANYHVTSTAFLRRIDLKPGILLQDYHGRLGIPGFTAWVAIELVGEVKAGSNVFISAAAGGVGIYAGQLAKTKGCRVIGSTGSDDKARLLKEEFGYDDAFNYRKETDFSTALQKYFPDGIDVYLDNVGGQMLEAVLNNVNQGARIPVCGMISQYNKDLKEREGVKNLLNVVGKEVKMQGFMIGSYLNRFKEFAEQMEGYAKEGKITSKETIYHGIESFLESLASVFTSSHNTGKVILQIRP